MTRRRRRFYFFTLVMMASILVPDSLRAAEQPKFEVFDGQVYNGKFYPRMDIIEWTYPEHAESSMEFHTYWKGKPIDMSFQLERKDGKTVMLVHYFIKERNEHLCRRVLAPGHFRDNFHVYIDKTDSEFDNLVVSMDKFPEKPKFKEIKPAKYTGCDLQKKERLPAANENVTADSETNIAPPPSTQERVKTDKGAIKNKNAAVPFSDW